MYIAPPVVHCPHGGLRPVHPKSTCLTQLTLWPFVEQIWPRNTPESGVNETRVLHRVGGETGDETTMATGNVSGGMTLERCTITGLAGNRACGFSQGEKMLYSGTDPESYITEYTSIRR